MPVFIVSRAMTIFGRIEMTTSEKEERCCGCLHVRFATILLGCYLVVSNTAFILFAPPLQPTAMSNGTFLYSPTSSDINTEAVKEAMAKNSEYLSQENSNKRHKTVFSGDKELEDFENAGVNRPPKTETRETFRSVEPLKHFVQCAIAMMMVYGAYSYKSMYLMPFICVRFFQLLRLILGIAGWLTHATRGTASNLDEPLETPAVTNEEQNAQSMNEAPPSDFITSSYGFSIGVIICLVYIGVLIYTLNIGFKCYKYILRHNRSVARAAAATNGQQVDGNGGVSFWGPDGSLNPLNPNADHLAGDPQAEEDLVEGMPAPKLPKYSEVAQDPEGKKYLIVTMPPNENASQIGCSATQELGPPPSFSEVTAAATVVVPIDEPPPCYDDVSIGAEPVEETNEAAPDEDAPNVEDIEPSQPTGSSRV